jgi:inorganic phosphate transporter, PiT family
MSISLIVIVVIASALIFEFVNGFHDTANAVATSISTKSLEPFQAIAIAAIFNLIGALSGTAVAVTIAKGFANPELATNNVLLATILAATTWNLITWKFGIPSSSSHALIGSLVGSIIFNSGINNINCNAIITKVFVPMIISPIAGFLFAILIVLCMHKILNNNINPRRTNNFIREIQVISTAFLSFGHGANDSQKTMGMITLVLFNSGIISNCEVPRWVIIMCAFCIALGTLSGGVKIIKTLSTRVAKLKPINGIAAEISSASILFLGSRFGIPLSTTHAISGAIMGASSSSGKFGINYIVVKSIIVAWIITFPVCSLISSLYLFIIQFLFH